MNTHNVIQIAKEFGFQLSVELLIDADGLPDPEEFRRGEVRRDLIARDDRLTGGLHALVGARARIEGELTDPWRPANGSPAFQFGSDAASMDA